MITKDLGGAADGRDKLGDVHRGRARIGLAEASIDGPVAIQAHGTSMGGSRGTGCARVVASLARGGG